jgi:hypothetical protein
MTAPVTRQQMAEHRHALAVMRANGNIPHSFADLQQEQLEQALESLERTIAERDRRTIAATINGPHRRNMAANQRDAGHLPLFIATNEGILL